MTTRGRCKHARKHVEVVTEPYQLPNLTHRASKTFERQKLGNRVRSFAATLEYIDSALGLRGQRRIFVAIDAKGTPHASLLLVFDKRHAFALTRETNEEQRASGADSLTMWETIRLASTRSRIFDFAGSIIPSIETIYRDFGARHVPRCSAVKQPHLHAFAEGLAGCFARRTRSGQSRRWRCDELRSVRPNGLVIRRLRGLSTVGPQPCGII